MNVQIKPKVDFGSRDLQSELKEKSNGIEFKSFNTQKAETFPELVKMIFKLFEFEIKIFSKSKQSVDNSIAGIQDSTDIEKKIGSGFSLIKKKHFTFKNSRLRRMNKNSDFR
jgi:hypothetical protein